MKLWENWEFSQMQSSSVLLVLGTTTAWQVCGSEPNHIILHHLFVSNSVTFPVSCLGTFFPSPLIPAIRLPLIHPLLFSRMTPQLVCILTRYFCSAVMGKSVEKHTLLPFCSQQILSQGEKKYSFHGSLSHTNQYPGGGGGGGGIKSDSLLHSNWKRQRQRREAAAEISGVFFVLVMRLRPPLTIHSGHSPAGLIIALERLWRGDKQAKGDVSDPSLSSQTNVLLTVCNAAQRHARPARSALLNAESSHVFLLRNDIVSLFFEGGRKRSEANRFSDFKPKQKPQSRRIGGLGLHKEFRSK